MNENNDNEFICPFSLNRKEPLYCKDGYVELHDRYNDESYTCSLRCRAWRKTLPVDDTDTEHGGFCKLIWKKQNEN